jgi:hypothetical protein
LIVLEGLSYGWLAIIKVTGENAKLIEKWCASLRIVEALES